MQETRHVHSTAAASGEQFAASSRLSYAWHRTQAEKFVGSHARRTLATTRLTYFMTLPAMTRAQFAAMPTRGYTVLASLTVHTCPRNNQTIASR